MSGFSRLIRRMFDEEVIRPLGSASVSPSPCWSAQAKHDRSAGRSTGFLGGVREGALVVTVAALTVPSLALFVLLLPLLGLGAATLGMGRVRRLVRIQLPLAWPVILNGIRVATLIDVAIAAVAALVRGPGFGQLVLTGLSRYGAANALIQVLVGTLGCLVVAAVLRQVDPALIEAARGMGMSARATLLRLELPLAVAVMVAGIRVAPRRFRGGRILVLLRL